MTDDDFWALVAEIRDAAGGDFGAIEGDLKTRLEAKEAAEVQAFARQMYDKMNRAYAWPLWAAAYVIRGGCSDDSFMDFRSSLIFMGQAVFEAALKDPDSLAELDDTTLESLDYEGLLYVPREVYEAKAGGELDGGDPQPVEPAGEAWDEDDEAALKALCPRLFERFW